VADARVFVMALTPGLRRCSADQTLLNAMSFGTVVVATDSMSSRLYIRDGENGFLVPENDPQALADTLRRVFTLAPQDYQRISRQAALDVQTHYREEQRLARTLQRAVAAARHYRVQRAQALSRPTRAARVFGMLALLL
jgi:glycosyltransferase involved in cell wall biosynthesis